MIYVTFGDVAMIVAYLFGTLTTLSVSYYLGWSDRETRAAEYTATILGGVMLVIHLFVA